MDKLIKWYKDNHYSQGDDYYVNFSPGTDLWIIGHSNDYPMQHGKGSNVRMRSDDIEKILNAPPKRSRTMWGIGTKDDDFNSYGMHHGPFENKDECLEMAGKADWLIIELNGEGQDIIRYVWNVKLGIWEGYYEIL